MIESSEETKSNVKTEAPVNVPADPADEVGVTRTEGDKGLAPMATTKKPYKSRKRKERWGSLFIYIILILVSILLLLPLVWMVSISLKPISEIAQYPQSLFTEDINCSNYT